MNIDIKQIHDFENEIEQQISQIYTTSFPPSEKMKFSEIVATVIRGDRFLFIAEEKDRVLGFALVKPLSIVGVFLLEYMAVAENSRSKGIGTVLLQHVVRILRSNNESAKGILLEVEPIDGNNAEEMLLRERRIRFYHQNGAYIIRQAFAYHMPDLSGEGKLNMHLMWIPLSEVYRIISIDSLKEYITSIYTDIYNRSPNDPLLMSILENIMEQEE